MVSKNVYVLENQEFCSYLICVCLLVLKMIATTLFVVFKRFRTKTFISEEDAAAWPGTNAGTKPNEEVERVRRAYQNDLETIPLFMIIALGYISVQPPLWAVNTLFIIYLITRTLHTIVYSVYVIRQPARALLWGVGLAILAYMTAHTAIYAFVVGYCNTSKEVTPTRNSTQI